MFGSFRVGIRLLAMLSIAAAVFATGCSSSEKSRGADTSSAGRSPASQPPALETDRQLDPAVRYPSPEGFRPEFTFQAPGIHWYPYLRGGSALNLRETTDPTNEGDGTAIEVVGDASPLATVVQKLLSTKALHAGKQHRVTIGGRPARWFDVAVARAGALQAPDALAGEQVDPAHPMRVYAVSGGQASLLFLIFAAPTQREAFLPRAEELVRSVRVP